MFEIIKKNAPQQQQHQLPFFVLFILFCKNYSNVQKDNKYNITIYIIWGCVAVLPLVR